MLPDPNLAVPAPLSALRPHPDNPRTISRERFAALVASLRADPGHLWQRPLGARRDGTVYLGNMRLLAARELGWSAIPVVYEDLPEAEERLRLLRDNREYGEDDERAVAEMPHGLQSSGADVLLSGFDPKQLTALLDSVGGAMPAGDDADLDPPAEPVTKPGDLWTLGEHRLLCGDATSPGDVGRLMGGRKADMLWTDPPYGVGYVGKTEDALTFEGDDAAGLRPLLDAAFRNAGAALEPGAPFYVAHPAGPQQPVFWSAARAVGRQIHQGLVWVKDAMVLGHSDYHYRHEPIMYGWTAGQGRPGRGRHDGSRWYGDHSQTSVLEFDRPRRSEDHPTMKPPELVASCLKNSSRRGDVVLDLFVGGGSTLLACEGLGRVCYAMEIDPRYCDVAVRRWEAQTGRKATIERREAVTA